jgi:hypothetical protein
MPTPTTYRFKGGPLDGQERRKHAPGRFPLYLDVEGQPLDTAKGDRIAIAAHQGRVLPSNATVACYVRSADDKTLYTYISSWEKQL